jgi:large subunit ribosomal protein L24e
MVIKTEVCAFSEDRIYPGHGSRLIRRDGQIVIFSSSKTCRLFLLKKRPAKLTWTTAWRRINKKISTLESSGRRRARRARAVPRGFVGASVADLRTKTKKATKGGSYAVKAAAREAARRAAKATKAAPKA